MSAKKVELRHAEKELYNSEEKLALYQINLGPLTEEDVITYAKRKVDCAFMKARNFLMKIMMLFELTRHYLLARYFILYFCAHPLG